jgi:asparagine synthase (glutamine-hydrolysing)
MCGIAGIFAYNYAANPVDRAALLRIRDQMAARGPDGSGEWLSDDQRVGFGHQRLSIIDLGPTGLQPMASADGRLIVTFNGEIFNYRALRRELEAKGRVFRSQSDTEVLLHLYAERGPDMLHALRGMFALAIWDRAEQRLFLARDPYGIKPLYYADDGWTLRFASQVKALLADSRVATDPEPAGVVGFHLYGSVPEPFTLYRSIRALPAGHCQIVDATGPRPPHCYANLAAVLAEGARRPASRTELDECVREAVRDSVAAHLVADVEVGLFLSAGIDSGAVTGLVRDAGHADVRAITLGFEEFRGTANDEVPLAAQVARRYGARHVVRRIGEREFLNDLPAILEAMDQPSIDGVNTWFVAKAAREAGLKVALSGLGGDELLAGYPSFRELPVWRRRLGPLSAIPGLGRLARSVIGTVAPAAARARPKLLGLLEHGHGWSGVYLLRRGLYLPHELNSILDPGLVREGLRRLDPLGRLEVSLVPDPGSDTGRVCALESRSYMLNQLLRDADWAGMAHGVEIRVPLVDMELTRQLAPSIATMLPGEGKAALARAPAQPLPDEVLNRPKSGFLVPTGAWMSAVADRQAATPARSSLGTVSRAWARLVLSKAAGGWHEARAA